MTRHYERLQLGVMNVVARIFGGFLLVVGGGFLLSAAVDESDRVLYAILGVLSLVGGAAFLLVKRVEPGDVERMLDGTVEPERTNNYEKKK